MSQELCSSLNCNVCLMLQATSGADKKHVTTNPTSTCDGCKLIKYCNGRHQKMDWPMHREFCEAVQKIKKHANIIYPMLLTGELKSNEDVEKTIVQLKYLLRETLGRPLQYYEEELTSNPVYCPICFGVKKCNVICPICQCQAYCSESHLNSHKEEHLKVCSLLQVYYTPYKTLPPSNDLELAIKHSVLNLEATDLRGAFERTFECKLPENPSESLKDYQLFSFAADFSCISTICYALSRMDTTSIIGKNFVVFIVGASVEAALWFREVHCKFLFQQFPQIINLELNFIGPEVIDAPNDSFKFELLGLQRKVQIRCFRGLFQTYVKYFRVRPSMIAVFNCGFSEFSQHYNSAPHLSNLNTLETLELTGSKVPKISWLKGLEEILYTCEIPIIFTSFTQQEIEFDFAALLMVANAQRTPITIERLFRITQNPYHDLRVLRQWYVRDKESFYYRNGYIQAIRTKLLPVDH